MIIRMNLEPLSRHSTKAFWSITCVASDNDALFSLLIILGASTDRLAMHEQFRVLEKRISTAQPSYTSKKLPNSR